MTSKTLAGSLMTACILLFTTYVYAAPGSSAHASSAAAKGPAVTVLYARRQYALQSRDSHHSSWPNGRMAKSVFDPNAQCCGRPEPGNQSRRCEATERHKAFLLRTAAGRINI